MHDAIYMVIHITLTVFANRRDTYYVMQPLKYELSHDSTRDVHSFAT